MSAKVATIYWLVWGVVFFGGPEFYSIVTGHPEGTLSDTVWRLFQVAGDPRPWHWTAVHMLGALFFLWLGGHLMFRIWR